MEKLCTFAFSGVDFVVATYAMRYLKKHYLFCNCNTEVWCTIGSIFPIFVKHDVCRKPTKVWYSEGFYFIPLYLFYRDTYHSVIYFSFSAEDTLTMGLVCILRTT